MSTGEIVNLARITNSTGIASCNKNVVVNFCLNVIKNLFNRNCSKNSKKVCENRKSDKKVYWNNNKTP